MNYWTAMRGAPHWIADIVLAFTVAVIGALTGGDPGWDALVAFVLGVIIFRLISARRFLTNMTRETS